MSAEQSATAGAPALTRRVLLPTDLIGPVWVASPHPDDESLGCGALIARLTDLGTEVWTLLLTDGGASHPASPGWPRERLARQRLREWHAGLDVLGVHPARRSALNLPDGSLPYPQHPDGEAALMAVRMALTNAPPATVLLPWRRDPHPDHRAAHALVLEALTQWPGVRLLEYAVWLPERAAPEDLPRPGEAKRWSVDVPGRAAVRKEQAIRAHLSQLGDLIEDDPGGFVLPEDMILRSLESPECLLEVNL